MPNVSSFRLQQSSTRADGLGVRSRRRLNRRRRLICSRCSVLRYTLYQVSFALYCVVLSTLRAVQQLSLSTTPRTTITVRLSLSPTGLLLTLDPISQRQNDTQNDWKTRHGLWHSLSLSPSALADCLAPQGQSVRVGHLSTSPRPQANPSAATATLPETVKLTSTPPDPKSTPKLRSFPEVYRPSSARLEQEELWQVSHTHSSSRAGARSNAGSPTLPEAAWRAT